MQAGPLLSLPGSRLVFWKLNTIMSSGYTWLACECDVCLYVIHGYGVSQLHLAQNVFQAQIMEAKTFLG